MTGGGTELYPMTAAKHHAENGDAAPCIDAVAVRALSESTSVGSIMTQPVTCLAPEATVASVTEMFLDRDLNAAPVVDERWLPMAMVSKTDLLRYWAERTVRPNSLSQSSPAPAPSLPPKALLPELAAPADGGPTAALAGPGNKPADKAADASERGLRVGCPHGPTMVAATPRSDGEPASLLPETLRVADITVPYVLSLHEEAPISVAAALMAYENVHRLPIVSSDGDVIGVVSTLDIVRWLAQTTGMGAGA